MHFHKLRIKSLNIEDSGAKQHHHPSVVIVHFRYPVSVRCGYKNITLKMLLSLSSVSNLHSKINKYELVSSNWFHSDSTATRLCTFVSVSQATSYSAKCSQADILSAFMFSSVVQLSAGISANPGKPGFLLQRELGQMGNVAWGGKIDKS